MFSNIMKSFSKFTKLLDPVASHRIAVTRGRKQWLRPYLVSLYKRRVDQGPEPDRPRSVWINWNYDAEIFAFGERLGEKFQSDSLRTAFTNRSYVAVEKDKRAELGLQDDVAELNLTDNEDFQIKGDQLAKNYAKAYLQHCYPMLPEEGIISVVSYLMSEENLSHIALNLGLKDLTLTQEFPPSKESLSRTFKAVIGALDHDQGLERSELFVQDFILTQLVGKSISDVWVIKNPMGILTEILKKQQRGLPEPRLLWGSGSETILSTYMVGIYSDKELIGQSFGETVTIAEEMAANNALDRIFEITSCAHPLPFGEKGRSLKLNTNNRELVDSSRSAHALA